MGLVAKAKLLEIDGRRLVIEGKFPRIIRVRSEIFDFVQEPKPLIERIQAESVPADVLTYVGLIGDDLAKCDLLSEANPIAVLRLSTYEAWWRNQINDKTRNMIRKAGKKGVELRIVELDDELVRGIKLIHDESPVRQGRKFKHYGKDFETVKKAHQSFLDRSVLIGAFYGTELIAFLKVVINDKSASIMQIIAKIAHRDKSPTNALLAKCVEICTSKGIEYLHYGIWGRRTLQDFKKHHDFHRYDLPRYFVPLTQRGKLALQFKLHRNIVQRVPGEWIDFLTGMRAKWYAYRFPQPNG